MFNIDFVWRCKRCWSGTRRLDARRERVLESLLRIENKVEKGLDSLNTRVSTLGCDVGWIKGKLEGTREGSSKVLTVVTVCTAVGAAIRARVALLT